MRIMVFGRRRTIQRLIAFLAGEEIEMVGIPDGLDEMMVLQEEYGFDLALVDSLAEEAEATCHRINKFGSIPLVLIVSQRQADWERLQSLGTDGYLPEEARGAELAARLRAILRRLCPAGQVEKSTPHP